MKPHANDRVDRLERALRAAHARRPEADPGPGLAAAVMDTIMAGDEAAAGSGPERLWLRLAAGTGFAAAASAVLALSFGGGLENDLAGLFFSSPAGTLALPMLGL